ncbi:zf-TFIIB domain-containing protein [Brevundimonas sp. VNH65]|uniref:TFIIB-type zinc ribbon-containing protein n=1 Tax=Brevundimonas sp. VNH65 TaxID=3400917 RepID=UPI003C07FDFF
MPLLMCPNDNAAMQTLERGGVQFDMCPTCRGVWLDRGELEKLMEAATADGAAAVAPPPQASQPMSQPWGQSRPDGYRQENYRPDDYRKDKYRRDDDDFYRRRKKRDSIFDIFD